RSPPARRSRPARAGCARRRRRSAPAPRRPRPAAPPRPIPSRPAAPPSPWPLLPPAPGPPFLRHGLLSRPLPLLLLLDRSGVLHEAGPELLAQSLLGGVEGSQAAARPEVEAVVDLEVEARLAEDA